MMSIETLERTNGLLATDDLIYAARQSGLHRLTADGDNSRSLFESWLPGQDVPTLAIAAYGELLLAGIKGGVARSADGGASWEAQQFRAPAPLVTCLALSTAFDDDGVVLAGTFEDGVFRSTDGGISWRAVNHALFDHSIYALALSPGFAHDGIVYAGTGSGVYRSENGGRLWWDLTMPAGRRNGAEPGAVRERGDLRRLRGAWSAALKRRWPKLGDAVGNRGRGQCGGAHARRRDRRSGGRRSSAVAR